MRLAPPVTLQDALLPAVYPARKIATRAVMAMPRANVSPVLCRVRLKGLPGHGHVMCKPVIMTPVNATPALISRASRQAAVPQADALVIRPRDNSVKPVNSRPQLFAPRRRPNPV